MDRPIFIVSANRGKREFASRPGWDGGRSVFLAESSDDQSSAGGSRGDRKPNRWTAKAIGDLITSAVAGNKGENDYSPGSMILAA